MGANQGADDDPPERRLVVVAGRRHVEVFALR